MIYPILSLKELRGTQKIDPFILAHPDHIPTRAENARGWTLLHLAAFRGFEVRKNGWRSADNVRC